MQDCINVKSEEGADALEMGNYFISSENLEYRIVVHLLVHSILLLCSYGTLRLVRVYYKWKHFFSISLLETLQIYVAHSEHIVAQVVV